MAQRLKERVLHDVLGQLDVTARDGEGAGQRGVARPEELVEVVVGHRVTPTHDAACRTVQCRRKFAA